MNADQGRALEHMLAKLLGMFRREYVDPIKRRLDLIEQRQAVERVDQTIAGRVMRGQPIPASEWLRFVRQIEGGQ
jgi:hypothetical protein